MLSNNQSIITIALQGVFLCKAIKFDLKTKFLSTVKLTVNRMAFEEIIKD
jgi:hypothetical protein